MTRSGVYFGKLTLASRWSRGRRGERGCANQQNLQLWGKPLIATRKGENEHNCGSLEVEQTDRWVEVLLLRGIV